MVGEYGLRPRHKSTGLQNLDISYEITLLPFMWHNEQSQEVASIYLLLIQLARLDDAL